MKCISAGALSLALALSAPINGGESREATPPALDFEAVYISDGWRNVRGGRERGGAYLDNLDLVATLDGEKAFGAAGTTVSFTALYNNRATLSDLVGDLQTVSNIDTDGSLRLYEAWMERAFERASVKLGLMNLNSEFDVNETGSLFINSSHGIGPEISQVGETGPSIFPITGLGLRGYVELPYRSHLRLGVFEGTPGDPDHPRRTAIELDGHEGALLIAELAHDTARDGRIAIGTWQHTRRFPRIASPERMKRQHVGAYALVEGGIAKTDTCAVRAFARVGVADADVHQLSRYYGAGLVVSGPLLWNADRDEQLGIAVGVATNGHEYRRTQRQAGEAVERSETAVELTYALRVGRWLALQPDLQYIINPGTDPRLRNALVVGVRFVWRLDRELLSSL